MNKTWFEHWEVRVTYRPRELSPGFRRYFSDHTYPGHYTLEGAEERAVHEMANPDVESVKLLKVAEGWKYTK